MIPTFPTIAALHKAYAAGLAPADMLATVRQRLHDLADPGIFITLLPDADLAARLAALGQFDPVGKPLWGIPFAVKDNIDIAGLPTTAGCPAYAYTPAETAPAVQYLLDAGAILIGKTNLDQFATGLVGMRSPYPPPKNAIDARIVPGGSSSGSAVAVAQGLVSFALGTDTAGSGRVPAALNNIVGLKPSLGAVSSRGVVPACRTLDTISIFAGTVADADLVYRTIAQPDPADPFSRPVRLGDAAWPPGLRVAVPDARGLIFHGDADSATAFAATRRGLMNLLGTPIEIDMAPFFEVARLLYDGPWVAERYQAIRDLIENQPDALHPITRQVIETARRYSAADAFAGLYRLAALRRQTDALWRGFDVLMLPSLPRPVSLIELAKDPIGPNSELGTYTNFVNLLDLCALSVPGPRRADGFASSVTLVAPRGRDWVLAGLGAALHAHAGVPIGASTAPVPPAQQSHPRAAPDEIELAVVGAHLSGMPLNHELTDRGARFLRAVATMPDYRLFALAGGPPARPGLLRVAPGEEGHAIATEVWAISEAGLGGFVAGVPAPLGIGTARLADGTMPKGFIVEPAGLAGGVDISHFGGWRAFIASQTAAKV